MRARRILVAYGTRYGQTAKIALRIAETLTAEGALVTLVPADDLPIDFSPHDYDGIVLGASIIGGRHQRSVRRLASAHRDALNEMPSAMFSVSGSAASEDEEGKAAARTMLLEFLHEAQWRPRVVELVAGAMAFTKYSFLLRWWMRRISAKAGGPTDTSRDHELTDWAQVERFALSFLAVVPQPEEAATREARAVAAR